MTGAYIVIYCDGSAIGNPGPSGFGATLEYKGVCKMISGALGHKTCNEAELLAVICSLQAIKKPKQHIVIHSDSQYVVKGWKREYKIATNGYLWKQLRQEVARHTDVQFNWVPRSMNQVADKLAYKAAQDGAFK